VEKRIAPRHDIQPIEISGFTSIDHMTLLARHGHIIDASSTGFLLTVNRSELLPKQFRGTLSLDELKGDQILLKIEKMNLEIGGTIARTKRITKDVFEIAIDYSADAPEYWRECLLDLLPLPGEME